VSNFRAAFDALRHSTHRMRWAAAHGTHSGWSSAPMVAGRNPGSILNELAGLADRLPEPPQVSPDRLLMVPEDVAPTDRRSTVEAS
jgi:hypothetical protein